MLAFFAELFSTLGTVFSQTWFIVLPLTLYSFFTDLWYTHTSDEFWGSIDRVILEIIPPREVEKSPKIMEAIYLGIAGSTSKGSIFEWHYGRKSYPFVSFEIVSTEGVVHFYVWVQKNLRTMIESNLYAQYPDIEIREVDDYTRKVPAVVPNKEWDLFAYDLQLTAPHDAIPIKTYQYFEEDVTGKMIDPLSSLIEAIGSFGKGHHFWFQMIVHPPDPLGGADKWAQKEGKAYVQELAGRNKEKLSVFARMWKDIIDVISGVPKGVTGPVEFDPVETESGDEQPLEFRLTPVEKEVLKNTETNIGKQMFVTKLRMVYLGRREVFSKANWGGFMGAMNQYSDLNFNGFGPHKKSQTSAYYVLAKQRLAYKQRQILRRYRNRFPTGKNNMMSSEELATLFHMPDMSVVSPAIQFVDSRRGGAPSNLPVQK